VVVRGGEGGVGGSGGGGGGGVVSFCFFNGKPP